MASAEAKARAIIVAKGGSVIDDVFLKGKHEYLKVKCAKLHEAWEVRLTNLIHRDSWCPSCYGNVALTIEQMKQLAIDRGGLCLSETYNGRKTKLEWQCAYNHTWLATPGNVHSHNSWCPHCKINLGEELVRAALEEAFPGEKFERTRSVPWMKGGELDGYNAKLRLCFEYQGKQHLQRVEHFQPDAKDFDDQLARDRDKVEKVEENEHTIFVIPCTIPYTKIRSHVRAMAFAIYTEVKADQKLCSDAEFYNNVRINGPNLAMQNTRIKNLIASKGGEAVTEYRGYRLPMSIRCTVGHIFEATPEAIDQKPTRGPRFCTECSKTKKISDVKLEERLKNVGWTFMSVTSEKRNKKTRRYVLMKCSKCNFDRTVVIDVLASVSAHKCPPAPKLKMKLLPKPELFIVKALPVPKISAFKVTPKLNDNKHH